MRTLNQVLESHPLPFELTAMQKEDIQSLANWGRALADLPVGSGKTVVSTVAALMLEPETTIVLLPPILQVQWVKWLRSIPGTGTVLAYQGSPAERKNLRLRGARWLVMSYQIFKNDFARLSAELANLNVLTIVDECQALKSHKSQLFKSVKQMSEGQGLLLLSGTPMSKPSDAYAYVKLLNPDVYRTYSQFEAIHVAKRDFFDQPQEWHNLDLMQMNLSKSRVYRTKEEVHKDLPRANYIPIYYDLDKEHMKLYQKLMSEQLLEIPDGKIDATTAQTLYHQSQQIISQWGYFSGDPSKVSKIYELLDQVCDEVQLGQPGSSKLLLWSQYRRTSRSVLEHMQARTNAVAAYSEVDSKKSVAAFLDQPEVTTLVAQPGSAGAGLNPQHLCWESAFVEIPTTTIPFQQAAGRIDRFGQKYNPNIRLFVARGTVQETLLAKLFKNDNLVQESSGTKTSIKDLIFPKANTQ